MGKIRLIIADEEPLFFKEFSRLIENLDTIELIGEATNGQAALDLIREVKPDVALLAQRMPVLDGISVIQEIRRTDSELKILLLSMHPDIGMITRGIERGADGFVLKYEEPSILKSAIESVMNKGFYFSENTVNTLSMNIQQPQSTQMFASLSQREVDILQLICKEYTSREIAEKLFISDRTVEGHRKNLFLKIGAKSTAGLILFAMKNNLLKV